MIISGVDSVIKAKVIKEWATQQSPYTLNKILVWNKKLTQTIPNLGEQSAYELLAEIILLADKKWKRP